MVAHSPLVLQFYLWQGTLGRVGFFPAADGAGSALASLFCAGAGSLYLLPSGIIGLLAHKIFLILMNILSLVRLRAVILGCVCVCTSFKEGIS